MKTIPPMNSPIRMLDSRMGLIIRNIGTSMVGIQIAGQEEIEWRYIAEIEEIGDGAFIEKGELMDVHRDDVIQQDDSAKIRVAIQQLERISVHVEDVNDLVQLMRKYDLDRALVMEIENQKLTEAQHIINAGYYYQITWLISKGVSLCRIRDLVNTALQVQQDLREEQERNR